MEVMGLMLGQFVDDYTITCVDVFAMPQVTSNISTTPSEYRSFLNCILEFLCTDYKIMRLLQ
jgi:26S proteasome regulatory subunit N11